MAGAPVAVSRIRTQGKDTGMNTHKPAGFELWDEKDIEDLVAEFELAFHRSPSDHD